MRQSLIVGARPAYTKGKCFPRVPLGAGNWRIVTENRQDSRIAVTLYQKVPVGMGEASVPRVAEIPMEVGFLLVEGPLVISAEIVEAGKEQWISVFAIFVNGDS